MVLACDDQQGDRKWTPGVVVYSTGLCYACMLKLLCTGKVFKIQGERAVSLKQLKARRWTLNHSLLFSSVSIILADFKLWRLRKNEFHVFLKHASTGLISCHGTRHLLTVHHLTTTSICSPGRKLWTAVINDKSAVSDPGCSVGEWVWCQAVLCIQGVKLLHSAWLLIPHLLKPNLIRWQASLKFDIDRIICTL